jgi:hypothetical protein
MMRLKEVVGSENEKRVRKEVENTLAALCGGSNAFLSQLERKALEKLAEQE